MLVSILDNINRRAGDAFDQEGFQQVNLRLNALGIGSILAQITSEHLSRALERVHDLATESRIYQLVLNTLQLDEY